MHDLYFVAVREDGFRVAGALGDLSVQGDRGELTADLQRGEQALDAEPLGQLHRLAVDSDRHEKTAHLSRKGCGPVLVRRAAFPSLELPSAGSRGPGPHPVLRRPPPATRPDYTPASSCRASASGSVTRSWQTYRRHTYAVGRPSTASRSARSGSPTAPGAPAAAPTTTRFGWYRRNTVST